MKTSLFARLLGALIVMAILAVGLAPSASASVNGRAGSSAAISVPARESAGELGSAKATACAPGSGKYAASSPLLPVNRWADATGNMHSRLDNTMLSDTHLLMQRNTFISSGMTVGNFMWSLGTGISAFSINFCVLGSLGGAADRIGAEIGKAVLGSGLLAGIVVISVLILLFQARRRGGAAWKTIIAKGAIVGLLSVMVAGSMASKGGGADGSSAPYQPGLMSPGWIVTVLNNTVSSLASAPASALAMPTTETGKYDPNNPLSCANYIQSLKSGYQETYGAGGDKLASGVPLIMSTLWEETGLQTWRMAQFGSSKLDGNTYCHLLDWNANVPVMGPSLASDKADAASTVRATMGRYYAPFYSESFYNSKAWQPTDNVSRDRSLVGFATCRLDAGGNPESTDSWSIQETFASGDSKDKVSDEDCRLWFTKAGDAPEAMDWSDSGDEVQKRTSDLRLRDFIMTLHGDYNYQGMTSVIAYNVSAFAMLLVFGLVSLSIIIAKMAMMVMIISVFFLLIMALLPSSGMDKLSGFFKMLLGMNIFIFGVQMIFALIAVLSRMLQGLGATFLGGDGSLFAIIWTGMAPLLAVYLLHMMFTKVMKVPSPFKLSAGLAWGASTAAIGGAAAAGVGSLLDRTAGHQGAKAMGAAKRAGGRGLNSAMSAASGGRLGKGAAAARRGAAAPIGAAAGTRGALAPGALPGALAGAKSRRGAAKLQGAFGAGAAGGTVAAAAGKDGVTEEVTDDQTQAEQVQAHEQSMAGSYADGKLDHRDLIHSNVLNSQLTRGKMSASDRMAMAQAGKAEQAAALAWEQQRRVELGLSAATPKGEAFNGLGGKTLDAIKGTPQALKDLPGNTRAAAHRGASAMAAAGAGIAADPLGAARRGARGAGRLASKAAVAARYSNAADQFRSKPIRTTAKVAGVGAALALSAPALAIPAVVAGAWAAKKGATALHENTAGRREIRDNRTLAYREAMRDQLKHQSAAKVREEAAAAPAGSGGSAPATPAAGGTAPSTQEGGRFVPSNSSPVTEKLTVVVQG